MNDNEPQMVFTPAQVISLWRWQFGPAEEWPLVMGHPFTCPNRAHHPEMAGDKGILVPTVRGWICPFCNYTQNWAHDFMMGAR